MVKATSWEVSQATQWRHPRVTLSHTRLQRTSKIIKISIICTKRDRDDLTRCNVLRSPRNRSYRSICTMISGNDSRTLFSLQRKRNSEIDSKSLIHHLSRTLSIRIQLMQSQRPARSHPSAKPSPPKKSQAQATNTSAELTKCESSMACS